MQQFYMMIYPRVEHLKIVLERLKNNDLKINLEKCSWFSNKDKILGHLVSFNNISMDEDKVKAIQDSIIIGDNNTLTHN